LKYSCTAQVDNKAVTTDWTAIQWTRS